MLQKKMKNDFNILITRFNTIEKNNAIENNPIEISQKRKKKNPRSQTILKSEIHITGIPEWESRRNFQSNNGQGCFKMNEKH